MKRYHIIVLIITCILLGTLFSCMKTALRLSSSVFSNFTLSIFEECDHELAKNSIPSNLKILEGLLKNDPSNKNILTSLCMGFCGYSMFFVEMENPQRASDLYLRAREYGLKALGNKGSSIIDLKNRNIRNTLLNIENNDFDALFWTTISWQSWINLNLDNPEALSQLERAESCLERILDIDAEYLYGLPYILKGISLSARPKMFGGDAKQAKEYFEKALLLSKRHFFPAQYYYARYYTVAVQDRKRFQKLLDEISLGDPDELEDVCLINTMIQHRAKILEQNIEEFFI